MISTPITSRLRSNFLPSGMLGIAFAGGLVLSACGAVTTTTSPATAPPPTIVVGDPGTTVPVSADTASAVTTEAPPAAPPPTSAPDPAPAPVTTEAPAPAPVPTTAPAPAPSTTTAPTTTTTTTTTVPLPVSVVDDADFFKGRHAESGGGINSQNFWFADPDSRRIRVKTAHGIGAIAEAAEVKGMLYTPFQPRSSDATITWNVSWNGYVTSFIGADSSARATVTVRVYEMIRTSGGPATIGPVVFSRTIVDDGAGAALQGVATLTMEGDDSQSAVLPPLDVDKSYRLEAELKCSSRVAFSIGATVCAFAEDSTSGLKVNDWSIRYDNVPAS